MSAISKRVSARSVLHLVQQYLRENALGASLAALQRETGVLLPGAPAARLAALEAHVRAGAWESVLEEVGVLCIPAVVLSTIHEQIFYELCAKGQWVAARAFAHESPPLLAMREG